MDVALEGAKFAAIHGDVSPLAEWLRQDRPITSTDKEFIADFLEGKIKAPRKQRGRPKKHSMDWTRPEMVAKKYHHIAEWLRGRGRLYGNAQRLVDALADKYGVDSNNLANEINRGRDYRTKRRRKKTAQK